MMASIKGHTEVVRELLKAHANPNAVRKLDGMTALSMGAQKGWVDVVNTLLDAGADINAGQVMLDFLVVHCRLELSLLDKNDLFF